MRKTKEKWIEEIHELAEKVKTDSRLVWTLLPSNKRSEQEVAHYTTLLSGALDVAADILEKHYDFLTTFFKRAKKADLHHIIVERIFLLTYGHPQYRIDVQPVFDDLVGRLAGLGLEGDELEKVCRYTCTILFETTDGLEEGGDGTVAPAWP